MWPHIFILSSLLVFINSLEKIPSTGIYRDYGDRVSSRGYRVVYGDEDMTIMNDLVSNEEKNMAIKYKDRLENAIKPLPAEDVKCMMSVDRFCSKEMGETKSIIIQAVKNDCIKCTNSQKDRAGKVIASMMAHDPVAWKLFLTRYDANQRVERMLG